MSTRVIPHWINNTPQHDADNSTLPVWNPATGEMQAEVVLATDSVVDDAVRSAAEAFVFWSEESLAARTKVMFAFREIINSRAGQLAEIISDEHGKVLSDAAGEVQRGLEVVEFACSLPTLTKGAHIPTRFRVESIRTRSANRLAFVSESRHSTFLRWCRCGCSQLQSHAEIPSC